MTLWEVYPMLSTETKATHYTLGVASPIPYIFAVRHCYAYTQILW